MPTCAMPPFLSHVLRNFIEERLRYHVFLVTGQFLSHVLRNFIEEEANRRHGNHTKEIPEPCAQELH